MTCCLVETVLLHAVHLSAIREQFVNIERYVSPVFNNRLACFMNVQAFILEDTDLINSRGSQYNTIQYSLFNEGDVITQ